MWGSAEQDLGARRHPPNPFERELIAVYSFPAPRRLTSSSPGSPKDSRTPVSFCDPDICLAAAVDQQQDLFWTLIIKYTCAIHETHPLTGGSLVPAALPARPDRDKPCSLYERSTL
jgi:hypothetical protein